MFHNKNKIEKNQILEKLLILKPKSIPIILEPHPKSSLQNTQAIKMLIPPERNVGVIIAALKDKLYLSHKYSLYLFQHDGNLNNLVLLQLNNVVGDIAIQEDGFVYLVYSNQLSFG